MLVSGQGFEQVAKQTRKGMGGVDANGSITKNVAKKDQFWKDGNKNGQNVRQVVQHFQCFHNSSTKGRCEKRSSYSTDVDPVHIAC